MSLYGIFSPWACHPKRDKSFQFPYKAGFTASVLKIGPPGETKITGQVLDTEEKPLPHASVRLDRDLPTGVRDFLI